MDRFEKGKVYFVKTDNGFYLVQQKSYRGWVAINFTHPNIDFNKLVIEKNGKDLFKYFQTFDNVEYKSYSINNIPEYRREMFTILKIGEF